MAQVIYAEPKKKQKAKQPTTVCSLGSGDRLRSSIEQFNRSFVGKQVLKSSFSLSGVSKRDQRCVFSNIIRHTYHSSSAQLDHWNRDEASYATGYGNQPLDIAAPRRLIDAGHTLEFNGVQISTDEIRLGEQYDGEEGGYDTPREFWMPYNLQCMEDISWNLNRRKCLPYGVSVSQQNNYTYNPQLLGNIETFPVYGTGLQPASGFALVKQSTNTQGVVTEKYLSDKLVSEPLLTDVDITKGLSDGESQCRKLLRLLNLRPYKTQTLEAANTTPWNAVGKYHTQLSNGVVYYTFSNTGDVDQIVDMVVHKFKDKTGVAEKAGTTITQRILDHYGENWMDARVRQHNQDLYAYVDKQQGYRPDDVYYNPKVKFLPSSLRLGRAEHQTQTLQVGLDRTINYSGDQGHDEEQGRKGVEFNSHFQEFANSPPFVDVYRQQVIVQAGKRKTIALRLPAKSYDPTKHASMQGPRDTTSILLNEHGFHVTFGVCGKKARTIIEPSEEPNDIVAQQGAKVIGVHHAPSSFKLIGRYYETVIPAVCVDPEIFNEVDMKLDLDVAAYQDDPRMQSATFNDGTNRDVIGRYTRLLVDGQATRAAALKQLSNFMSSATSKAETSENMEVQHSIKQEQDDAGLGVTVDSYLSSLASTDLPSGTSEEQAKLAEEYGFNLMSHLDHQVSSFKRAAAFLGDTIPSAKAWYDGSPVTVKTIYDFGEFLVNSRTGDKAKAAEKLSGLNLENMADIWQEQKAAFPGFYTDFQNAAVTYMNTPVKQRRRLTESGTEVVAVDGDTTQAGIQQSSAGTPAITLTTTGTAGSLVWLPTGSEKLELLGMNTSQFQAELQDALNALLVSYSPTQGLTDSFGVPNYIQNDDGTYRLQRFELKLSSSSTYSNKAVLVENSSVPEVYVDDSWFDNHSAQYNGTAILGGSNNTYLVRGVDWDVL